MAELALDDDQRHAFEGHLDGVGVPELVSSDTPADTGCGGRVAKVGAGGGGRPMPTSRRTIDHAKERPDGQLESELEPWLEFVPAPGVHADFASTPALTATDEQRAAAVIEVGFGVGESLLDAQPGAPEDHDQAA